MQLHAIQTNVPMSISGKSLLVVEVQTIWFQGVN